MNDNLTFNNIKEHLSPTVQDYIERMKDTPQGHVWHPETNVLVHSKIVFTRALKTRDVNVVLAAFFHDLGKVDTTTPNDKGGFSAHNHEVVSADLVKYSKHTIKFFGGNPEIVYWLVINHMRVKCLDEMTPKKRKNLQDHIWFPLLEKFALCDRMGTLNIMEVINAGGNPFRYLYNKFIK